MAAGRFKYWFSGAFVLIPLYTAAVISLVVEFQQKFYDWDLDTEMYFGNEILSGRPIWISEFHDKLPGLQVVFSLPAAFGDINVWRAIGVFLIVITIFVATVFASDLLPKLEVNRARFVFLLAGALNILVVEFTPGGISHINSSAASLAAIATILSISTSSTLDRKKTTVLYQILGGIAGALSVSIRPYFALPLLVVFAILIVQNLISKSPRNRSVKRMWQPFVPISSFISCGILLNVSPFIFLGKFGSFVEGLKFLAQPLVPLRSIDVYLQNLPGQPLAFSLASLFQWAVATWSTILFLVSALLLTLIVLRKLNQPLLNLLITVSVTVLAFSTFSQHWWPHYSNMFSWYGAILGAYACVQIVYRIPARDRGKVVALYRPLAFTAALISFVIAGGVISLSNSKPHGDDYNHPREQQFRLVSAFLQSEFTERPSFLSPEDMYVHWKLRETRHGFPHAGNTVQITQDWWVNIRKSNAVSTPTNIDEYCKALNASEIKVIFLDSTSRLNSCFEQSNQQERSLWEIGDASAPNILRAYVLK